MPSCLRKAAIGLFSIAFASASASLLAADFTYTNDFEAGTLSGTGTSSFSWWYGNSTSVSQERAYSGSHSLRFFYEGGADGKDSFAEQRFRYADTDELRISYKLFVPTNFYHRRQSGSANNKFMFLWSGDYGTVASNQSFGFEYWPTSDGNSVLSHHLGPDNEDWGHKRPTSNYILSTADRGKWIDFEVYVKLASAEGVADGIIEVKKNGQRYFRVENLANYASQGNFLNQGYLLGWSNSGFDQNTVFYLDDLKIVGGSSESTASPPEAPELNVR